MKSKSFTPLLLAFLTFCAPTPAYGWRVTTVETRYIEPEPVSDAWLIMNLVVLFSCLFLADNYAKNYVEQQEDIDLYSATVKIKHGSKTIDEATFSSSEYDEVIDEVLAFAKQEVSDSYSLVIRPSITISGKRTPRKLGTVTKPRLPSKPEKVHRYWERLDRELVRTFEVPARRPEPRTHVQYVEHHHVTVAPQPWYTTFWIY